MNKNLLILLFIIPGALSCSSAQSRYDSLAVFRTLTFGSSYAYIWDEAPHFLRERTFSLNAAVSITSKFSIGYNQLLLWVKSSSYEKKSFQLGGVFCQYYFFGSRDGILWFFPEIGYYRGNYCNAGAGNPYYRKGLNYLSFGGGAGIRLGKHLSLDLAFLDFEILNRIPKKYNYTQYIIGLNFRLGLKSVPGRN